jgi:TonB-dependent SusC/RagA subfamily outer membrane receptor
MAGNRVRWVALYAIAVSALGMSTPGLPAWCVGEMALAQQVAATTEQPLRDGQRVTVNVENMPLLTVLQTIAQQAGLVPMYDATLIPSQRRVSLHVREISASDAFEQALRGTGLVAQIHAKGQVVIMRGTFEQAVAGDVTGLVRDSATKQPITGVTVALSGTRYAARTGADGRFRLAGVPAGTYRLTVRRIGYRSATVSVQVTDDAAATVSVSLMPANTELSEVVTTAVGQQRRLEVGNVIAHLNVDSIAKTAPVTSVTDLLSARAPGVQVVENSGLVGAGASIRIRGQSSMVLPSDPIIIVDGVRQDNTAGGSRYDSYFGSPPSPSRINDIDVNQIETIDILKGPAASTEYGTDAANGVIVITTKKGKTGATLWHVS